jgi:hypothetical protein
VSRADAEHDSTAREGLKGGRVRRDVERLSNAAVDHRCGEHQTVRLIDHGSERDERRQCCSGMIGNSDRFETGLLCSWGHIA